MFDVIYNGKIPLEFFLTDDVTSYTVTVNDSLLSSDQITDTWYSDTLIYLTDSDINDVIADIDEVYQNVILSLDIDPLVSLAIDKCRIDALNVLNGKIQTTPKVVDFELFVPTVDVELEYRLYAEDLGNEPEALTTKADVLTELNGILPNRYKGIVQVLKV